MLLMRSRTERGSRWMWWCANIWARVATRGKGQQHLAQRDLGSTRARPLAAAPRWPGTRSRSSRTSLIHIARRALKRSYSCSGAPAQRADPLPRPRCRPGAAAACADLISAGWRPSPVFARQLQLQILHQLDVAHVLARDLGDGYSRTSRFWGESGTGAGSRAPRRPRETPRAPAAGIYRSRGICSPARH